MVALSPLPPMPQACAYLAGRTSLYEHYALTHYTEDGFSTLLETGYRHFGRYFFRPILTGGEGCAVCGACLPMRVPVAAFRPSKSQRRVRRRGTSIRVSCGMPRYSDEKYELYLRHKQRFRTGEQEGGAGEDREGFRFSFYQPLPCTRECQYHLNGNLIGVGLIDLTSRVLSSIYFFFDPEYEHLSPGTLSVLYELRLAGSCGIPHYYLGYTMAMNRSLRYKMQFQPNEYFDGKIWHPLLPTTAEADVAHLRLQTG